VNAVAADTDFEAGQPVAPAPADSSAGSTSAPNRLSYEDWERQARADQGYRMRTLYQEPLI